MWSKRFGRYKGRWGSRNWAEDHEHAETEKKMFVAEVNDASDEYGTEHSLSSIGIFGLEVLDLCKMCFSVVKMIEPRRHFYK